MKKNDDVKRYFYNPVLVHNDFLQKKLERVVFLSFPGAFFKENIKICDIYFMSKPCVGSNGPLRLTL